MGASKTARLSDQFVRKCAQKSIKRLELPTSDEESAITEQTILDFCFRPDVVDIESGRCLTRVRASLSWDFLLRFGEVGSDSG